MQHAGTYIKLLHTVTTKIKALKSWCQLLYTYDEKRRIDPVGYECLHSKNSITITAWV